MMKVSTIGIDELEEYIDRSFEDDYDLFEFQDRGFEAETIDGICKSVYDRIRLMPEPKFINGIVDNGEKIGYFVSCPFTLISFGMRKEYRDKEHLTTFFEFIKKQLGGTFQCPLFGHNTRAIKWLEKCGMNILFDNITILDICQS